MNGIDFNFFERLYVLISDFCQSIYNIFFVTSLRSLLWESVVLNNPIKPFNVENFNRLMDYIPDSIENVPIGFGIMFGMAGVFVVYTLAKWVLDIVF